MENKYILNWDAYAKTARSAAAEGAVLLENKDSVLPLKSGERIAIFGRMQFHYYKSGTGSGGLVNTKYEIGILDALRQEKDLVLDAEVMGVYEKWIAQHPFDKGKGWAQEPWSQAEMPLDQELVRQASKRNDTALIILGRTAGEDRDAEMVPGSYLLTDLELDMLQKVCREFARTVVLLNVGGIIDMKWAETYHPSAVLYVWQGGMTGGLAVADLLTGRVSPSGKLTDTIVRSMGDYPAAANFGDSKENLYKEDIYVGYRYFETFAKEDVQYPFGYGLSYTKFGISFSEISKEKDGTVRLSVKVKNEGTCSGKEVVQIYCSAPQGKLGKPVRSLVTFQKTELLQPGEEQVICFDIPEYRLASYDDSGKTGHKSAYILEKGCYEFYVGTDVRSAKMAGSVSLSEDRILEACQEALSPVRAFERIRPAAEGDGQIRAEWESVPVRSYDLSERIREEVREDTEKNPPLPYTGDQGYRLEDVYDGTISIETFLAQLTDQELCCMTRGEGMASPKVTPGTAAAFGGVTEELQAYGIPCGCCSDGPSGIRLDCGTYAFSIPNGTCLACTFNEELNTELFRFMGAELRKNRIDTLLGPGINIHRNPLNGRNFEYFSEDPLVTGKIAAAQLKGMHEYGVTGTIKHFVANNQEYSRRFADSVISERALREIYLKGFEIAVKEGGAYSVMTSYGPVNGTWTGELFDLNTTILRKEWGFDGIVMTDWWAMRDERPGAPKKIHLSGMVESQNDLYMVVDNAKENSAGDDLEAALEQGTLTRPQLLRCAEHILKFLLRSPVMRRSLGRLSEEEKEAERLLPEEDRVEFDVPYYFIGDEAAIDVDGLDTSRGKSMVFGIRLESLGTYELCMSVKIDAGEVAQVPVSFFSDGKLVGTKTLNGTQGRETEIIQTLPFPRKTMHYVKLYFAQSGMEIVRMTMRKVKQGALK